MSDDNSNPPIGFRVIPGFPRYAIDENGTVLSVCVEGNASLKKPWTNAKQLRTGKDTCGYRSICLCRDGKVRRVSVHTLVLTTFVGPCPDGMQCRHLDGNTENNHINNLAWGTIAENHNDKILHGTSGKGEKNSSAKLKAADVLEIRARAENGERHADIANAFSVNQTAITKIVRRERWNHI